MNRNCDDAQPLMWWSQKRLITLMAESDINMLIADDYTDVTLVIWKDWMEEALMCIFSDEIRLDIMGNEHEGRCLRNNQS